MDKCLTFSVAGSGKTTRIVNSINIECRTLILTYTLANTENIRRKIIQKFGAVPPNVKISPFTSFLYSNCFRPLLHDQTKEKGLTFRDPERSSAKKSDYGYYVNSKGYVYHSRMGLAFTELQQTNDLFARLERFFDHVFIDEVQDLASRDFDFILLLSKSKMKIDLVGDFFQHTYDSSRDGNYSGSLFDSFETYRTRLLEAGYQMHSEQLNKSYRCSSTICGFVQDKLGISIESHRADNTEVKYVEDQLLANELRQDDNVIKLFYNNHQTYNCFSKNWGECKGEDNYGSVCVVLNKTTDKLYKNGRLRDSAPMSKNKLYVAITRARGNVYLVPPQYFEPDELSKRPTQSSQKQTVKRRKVKN